MDVAVAPLDHFVVGHQLLKSVLPYHGPKFEQLLLVWGRRVCGLNALDRGSTLVTFVVWIVDESSAEQGASVNSGKFPAILDQLKEVIR